MKYITKKDIAPNLLPFNPYNLQIKYEETLTDKLKMFLKVIPLILLHIDIIQSWFTGDFYVCYILLCIAYLLCGLNFLKHNIILIIIEELHILFY